MHRLMYSHETVVKALESSLMVLVPPDTLSVLQPLTEAGKFKGLIDDWNRSIVQRTAGLLDLMFKAVGLRDAQDSFHLGTSMWRISWITFIFLPLTFTVGVFGMSKYFHRLEEKPLTDDIDVDTFKSNPSIKWWVLTSILTLLLVLLLWYAVKHGQPSDRKSSLRRGFYENFYQDLTLINPELWTERGPRAVSVRGSAWDRYKWRRITTWFGSEKLKSGKPYDAIKEDFSPWNDAKRGLTKCWLRSMPRDWGIEEGVF